MKTDRTTLSALLILGLGVVAAGATGYLIYQKEKDIPTFTLYAVEEAIVANQPMANVRLTAIQTPVTFRSMQRIAVFDAPGSSENLTWLRGQRAGCDLSPRDLVPFSCFEMKATRTLEDRIEPGQRAMTLPVRAETSVNFFVRPGSRVDLMGTIEEVVDGVERERTLALLQNVRIEATGRALSAGAYKKQGPYKSVTVFLSPEDVEKVIHMKRQLTGPITLVLRNPGDDGNVETPDLFVATQ